MRTPRYTAQPVGTPGVLGGQPGESGLGDLSECFPDVLGAARTVKGLARFEGGTLVD